MRKGVGGVTARLEGGPGPTVVLIHGWCCDGSFWRPQVSALADRFQLAIVDLGHPDPETHNLSLERAGADLAGWLLSTGCLPAVLVGHSMGGPVALEAALRLGSRCRAVIGVDTFTDAAFYAARPEDEIAARLAPFAADFAGTMSAMVEAITLVGGATLKQEIAAVMGAAPPGSACARLAALLRWDIAAVWPAMTCPVYAFNSLALDPPDRRLRLPGLLETMLPEVGHFPMLEAPGAFNAHLARCLAGILAD